MCLFAPSDFFFITPSRDTFFGMSKVFYPKGKILNKFASFRENPTDTEHDKLS